jgi:hypothetical protein
MFVLNWEAHGHSLIGAGPWAVICCASFEERCLGVSSTLSRLKPPAKVSILDPRDTGSIWEDDCSRLQNSNLGILTSRFSGAEVNTFSLFSPDIVEVALEVLKSVESVAPDVMLVIDMSAMPKGLIFPLVRFAMSRASCARVVVTYTEPATYGPHALHSDPALPASPLTGHDRLPISLRTPLAWIPILGFGSFFAEHVYDAISGAGILDHRIYPLVGFPGFDPTFYDRMLVENGEVLLSKLSTIQTIRDQFLFAPAGDPFQTRDVILRTAKELPPDVHLVGSPLGPRPMALGMLLAALEQPFTIMHCQAKSYHPTYSSGIKVTHAYPLKGF